MLRCLKEAYTNTLTVCWLSGLVLSQPSYEPCWSWTLRDEWYIVMKAYLLLYNFEILVLLYCVSVLSPWYELYVQCHRLGHQATHKDNQEPCEVCGWFKLPGQD